MQIKIVAILVFFMFLSEILWPTERIQKEYNGDDEWICRARHK